MLLDAADEGGVVSGGAGSDEVRCVRAGDSSIDGVAGQLIVSPRTLQRQLRAEGTSYQTVLTETRERLARRYLAENSITVAQIAYLLAYDDVNSFYRAFRHWTGATPETVRTDSRLTTPM